MPIPPSVTEVERMVRIVLKDRMPKLYRRLLASGQLEDVAKARGQVYEETLDELMNKVMSDAHYLVGDEKVRALNRGQDSAIEQALAVALEFADDSDSEAWQSPLSALEKLDLGVARLRERYLRVHCCEPPESEVRRWKARVGSGINRYARI